jgi:Rad3-related DNA helicase
MAARKKAQDGPADILSYFPGTPRAVQEFALRQGEDALSKVDVLVIELPTGSGKTRTGYTFQRYLHKELGLKSAYIVPTNILMDQVQADFPKMHSLRNMQSYDCSLYEEQTQKLNCFEARACSKDKKFCKGCPYMGAVRKSHVVPYAAYTYHTYLAHRLYRDVLVIDEAHLTLPLLRSMAGKRLWYHQYQFPSWVNSYGKLLRWVEKHPKLKTDSKLQMLLKELTSGKTRYLVQRGTDLYHGREEECLKLLPIDIRDNPPILWPGGKVKKIILMSATINRKDVEQLGLDKRRVRFISAPSPIPKEQRPIFFTPVGNASFKHQEETLPLLASFIRAKLQERPEKGIIHAPYSMAEKLRDLLTGEPRLLFHNQENKSEVYQAFRNSSVEGGSVLVASGLYEGISLDYDAGRWQVIAKVPYANLAEPAIAWQAETDPESYAWEAIKLMAQASGRICRTPTDWGHTFITDSAFERLRTDYQELLPSWFAEAIVEEDER